MAEIMTEMGNLNRQVISITHLPQIASMGTHHYKVLKEETKEGTLSHMKELKRAAAHRRNRPDAQRKRHYACCPGKC